MSTMTVRDAMHQGVVSCDSSVTVREAARIMNERRLRSLIIVDFDCALAGIISASDIVAAKLLNQGERAWDQLTVDEIMTNRVHTVTPDMPLTEAAKLIVDHRIHRAVVAEAGDICNPIGILSLGDIMRYVEGLESGELVFASDLASAEIVEASVTILAPAESMWAESAPGLAKRAARKPVTKVAKLARSSRPASARSPAKKVTANAAKKLGGKRK